MAEKKLNTQDTKFIKMMIPHHEDALKMAKAELKSGASPQVKQVAAKIVETQSKEINKFKAILKAEGKSVPKKSSTPMKHK